jgi:predicted DNA-binding protein with PD1-like motif
VDCARQPARDSAVGCAKDLRCKTSFFTTATVRTFAVILETGEEVSTCLQEFVTRERVLAAQITAIGALSDVVLLYFDWDKKAYLNIPVREQVEVASLVGDVAEAPSGEPALHLHLVVGKRDGAAMAGHLGEAHVRPTLEVIVTESPTHLRKFKDPETGLALIRPAA